MNINQKALNIVFFIIFVVAAKLILFPGGQKQTTTNTTQAKVQHAASTNNHHISPMPVPQARASEYKREPFKPYDGEITINIQQATNLGQFTPEEFAKFRVSKVKEYAQSNIFPSNYDPFAYPHREIYQNITFGTGWTEAAQHFISNPYLLVTLSAAYGIYPMEVYSRLPSVHYKNKTIEEVYTGQSAQMFFAVFDPKLDFPGGLRLWVVNAQDAGLMYANVDKSKCTNIDFNWRDTPDNIVNSVYSLNTIFHVGQYQLNNISPDCRRSTLMIKEKYKYTCIYVKLWVKKPKSIDEKEDFTYIIKVNP